PFELLLFFSQARAGERRRKVPDGDGPDAPLGLRCFARIADDEGIYDGQRSGDDLGEARTGKRDRLARQPFQRAVGADMNERVTAELFSPPQAEGNEAVDRKS